MLDLDSIEKELPPGSRLGLLLQHGKGDHLDSPSEGSWSCTLLNAGGLHATPCYAQGNGTTPSIAFARAKIDWNNALARSTVPRLPPAQRSLTKLSLEDLF